MSHLNLAFVRWVTPDRRRRIEAAMRGVPHKTHYNDGLGLLAYRPGLFDVVSIEGVKDFTPALLAAREACCRACHYFDDYEYLGETWTLCGASGEPDCHACHLRILHGEESCPHDLLPVEVDRPDGS